MTRRVLFASILICGAPLVIAIDCTNLSPYPDVYDQVYEAGHQSPAPGNGTEPIDGGGTSDGEMPNDCPTGSMLLAVTVTPQWVALDNTNVYWATNPANLADEAGLGTFGSNGAIQSVARLATATTPSSLLSSLTGATVVTTGNGYLAYSALGPSLGSTQGTVGLFTTPSGAGAAVPGMNQTSPAGVAIDSENVYWVSSVGGSAIAVQSAPLSGGAPVTVATVADYSGGGLSVSTGTNTLYFTGAIIPVGTGGAVFAVPTGGGTPTPLQTFGTGQPNDLRTDATNVYWDDKVSGSVFQMALGGGTITTLATGLMSPNQMAVDSKNVYVVDDSSGGNLSEIPIGGGATAKTLATTEYIFGGVAADDTDSYVYFSLYSERAICKVAK